MIEVQVIIALHFLVVKPFCHKLVLDIDNS